MTLSGKEMLKQLGSGKSIDHIRKAYKITRPEFDIWWKNQTRSRVPNMSGSSTAAIKNSVNIIRDKWGIPHIFATDDKDLFFGYGYAMAQDRLWQLDYLRRKALGQLSEILGPDGLDSDIATRTVGINRIAAAQIKQLPSQTFQRLERFSLGINAAIKEYKNHLPIEFDLLDYEPESWSPLDSVAVWVEFQWYLTGRLPVISIPEIVKRVLGPGTLYQAFLCGEADDESILYHGIYPSEPSNRDPVGESISDPSEGLGSNNWVVSGKRSASHLPMVASDPHIAFGSTSCWYEVHLSNDTFNVAGTGYVGVPMVLFGRNEQVAWGLTNNICSQRDLYKEQINDRHPGCFLYDGQWEQSKQITERIKVKDQDVIHKTIRFSRNGPIVDELLPASAKNTGPVSLRWVGKDFSDELSCMLRASEALNCEMFRQAFKEWKVPTWSVGFADVHGDIGYQCIGRIPIRHLYERGYKPGWDPQYQWKQQIPFESMPTMSNPKVGWIRSANNRTAPNDFPYPLSGTWASGYRAARIRNMLEKNQATSKQDFARMQTDCLSLRAIDGVPGLLSALSGTSDNRLKEAISHLESWDSRMEPDRVGASIFELFFNKWTMTVAKERFNATTVSEIAGSIAGLALTLLADDNIGWFTTIDRVQAIAETFREVVTDLESRLGEDMSSWTWGKLHTIRLPHPLTRHEDLSQLLSRGGQEVRGNGITVCNTGYDPNYMAAMGANYRLIADLADSPPGLWAVDAAGQSGHPGSIHYCDQLPDWLAGRYHYLTLDKDQANADAVNHFTLIPQTS